MSKKMEFKIGIVAPSRIGKTSLVTALLSDSQKLLAGTPVVIKANDLKTTAKINQHKSELRGSLREGEFNTGAMQGTQESFEFNLLLKHTEQDDSNGMVLRLLDFPGGWMNEIQLGNDGKSEQAKCAQFIRESSVLFVVVDASILMEASGPSQRKAINGILNVPATEDIVREWAKSKANSPDDPALLLICPVKCESYFNDNGGSKDQANKLLEVVMDDVYRELLPIVKEEGANQAEIMYMPVDTLGCVEFVSAHWEKDPSADGGYIVNPHFKVRKNAKESVKGADDVLIAIAKQLVSANTRTKKMEADGIDSDAKKAMRQAAEDKYWFQKLFGYETAAEKEAKARQAKAKSAISEAESLGEVVQWLSDRQFGSRVRSIRKGQA